MRYIVCLFYIVDNVDDVEVVEVVIIFFVVVL